jgi:hypothetical protein
VVVPEAIIDRPPCWIPLEKNAGQTDDAHSRISVAKTKVARSQVARVGALAATKILAASEILAAPGVLVAPERVDRSQLLVHWLNCTRSVHWAGAPEILATRAAPVAPKILTASRALAAPEILAVSGALAASKILAAPGALCAGGTRRTGDNRASGGRRPAWRTVSEGAAKSCARGTEPALRVSVNTSAGAPTPPPQKIDAQRARTRSRRALDFSLTRQFDRDISTIDHAAKKDIRRRRVRGYVASAPVPR